MTKAELFLKNYPQVVLNNLSNDTKYYGYSTERGMPEKMTSIVENFDWSSGEIGVLDDFKFELICHLHFEKGVPLENITLLVSDYNLYNIYENLLSFTGVKVSSIEENELQMKDKRFDLIIMNPPYKNSFYKKIIDKLQPYCNQLCLLCPWDLVTAAREGISTRELLNNHVITYTQVDGNELFGSICVKLTLGSFDFTKNTGKYLLPYLPDSIDDSIIKKFQAHKYQLKDYVYWQYIPQKHQCKDRNGVIDPVKLDKAWTKAKEFVNSSYNHQILHAGSAIFYIKRLLTKPDEIGLIAGFGIKNKEGLDLITTSSQSKDWQVTVLYVIKLVGDGRDFCRKEVSYTPLFTDFKELGLTKEEIEHIEKIAG